DSPNQQAKPETTPTPCALHKVVRSAGLDSLPGARHSVAQDYTHPARGAQFEIFMVSIGFSDAGGPDSESKPPTDQALVFESGGGTVSQQPRSPWRNFSRSSGVIFFHRSRMRSPILSAMRSLRR